MNRSKLVRSHVDEDGYARARPLNEDDVRADSLAYMLEAGMQGSVSSAQKALDRLTTFERGEKENVTFGGNDIGIKVNKEGAVYVNYHLRKEEHPVCHYTIDELRDALEDWRDLNLTIRESS